MGSGGTSVAKTQIRIDTRSERARRAPRHTPYWHTIERGLAVGYYRARKGAGTWWARAKVGTTYRTEQLGPADDGVKADGETALDWAQAQAAARAWASKQTSAGPITVKTVCDDYVADLRARKGERAAREAEGRLKKHLLPLLGARMLAGLTAADMTAWRNGMVRTGNEDTIRRSRDSANRMLATVKAAFNLAFNTGRVVDDRAWRRVQAFKGAGESRKIGKAMLRISGKTGGREIHLPPAPLALLRKLASGKRPDGYLLTTSEGGPWTKSLHTRRFAAAVARAGLDPDTTFYALRHTWISRALVAGVPTKAVADHTGTSIAMIQRYYAKFIPGDQARYAALAAP
ncbi:MAG: hypothetical protein K0R41_4193, partial [Geminicoccaceae bacterium]|nr:hypothetical protein [Geminicoccaceae bacterium]